MSKEPNTVAIGAFVTGALLIAITAIIFALGTGFGGDRSTVIMVFDGSVKGLSVGAPVALRGVQIGQVSGIELILDSDSAELIMLVEAEFQTDTVRRRGTSSEDLTEELIARGLRAQLNTQSLLTGLLYIQLDFHPDSELVLADVESTYLQIPTIPTELERITRKLESIDFSEVMGHLETIAMGVSTFVSSEAFQTAPHSLQEALSSVTHLSTSLQQQLASTGPKLDVVLTNATQTVGVANEQLPKLALLIEGNLKVLESAIAAFESGMSEFGDLVDHDSATIHELNRTLKELGQAGRAVQLLAKTLEEQPEALIRGRSSNSE